MQKDVEGLIRALPPAVPPADMSVRIRSAIQEQARLQGARLRLSALASGFVAALATVVSFWSVLMVELAHSSFMSYASLVWTDSDAALANWKDVALSLLESLPVANIMAWLLLAFFVSGLVYMIGQLPRRDASHRRSFTAV
jgi:hypothetical protein